MPSLARLAPGLVLVPPLAAAALLVVSPGALLPVAGAAGRAAAGRDEILDMRFAERERRALVHVPDRLAERPALVLLLHGVGGDAARLRAFTAGAFERAAAEHGFLLAYPEAVDGVWRDCRPVVEAEAGTHRAAELERATDTARAALVPPPDDVAFLRALVARLAVEHGPFAGVFAAGYSNGGHMALRLAFEAPELVDAIATFGTALPVDAELGCEPEEPLCPTLLVAGTADPVSPFAGGRVTPPVGPPRGLVRSARASAEWLARRAGIAGEPTTRWRADRDPHDLCRIEEHRWSAERSRPASTPARETVLLVIHGGGHALPLLEPGFPELVGPCSRDLDGATELWTFFARHRR